MATTSKTADRNVIDAMGWYRIINYLQVNRQRLEGVATLPEITKEYNHENPDMAVSERTIRTALEKLDWKTKRAGNGGGSISYKEMSDRCDKLSKDLADLTARYERLHARYVDLADRVQSLETGLGVFVLK